MMTEWFLLTRSNILLSFRRKRKIIFFHCLYGLKLMPAMALASLYLKLFKNGQICGPLCFIIWESSLISMPSDIPKAFYLDAKTFNPITQKIFDSSWSCFRQEENSLKQNDCIPIEHQNTPLLLSYKDNKLNLLSNVCTHRAHILIDQKTNNNCMKAYETN